MSKSKVDIINTIFVVLCIGCILNTNFTNISASFPAEFYKGESFTWTIDIINEGNIIWWNVSAFTFVANWHAENNSEVNFVVTDYTTIDETNYLIGELAIGNLTLETNCQDIGFNLALSVYPWYGGLVSLEDNWYELSLVPPFDNETIAQITYDKEVTVMGQVINAIQIKYDDGFQQSIFVYNPITGILLSSETISGLFHLKMHLIDSTIPLPTIPSSLPLSGLLCVLVGLGYLILYKKRMKG